MATRPGKILARIITIALIAVLGFFFEDFKEWVPWLTELQVRSYNWISKLSVRKPRPQWVIGVEIDDATFYDYLKLSGQDVTDRATLAELIRKAADAKAAVIALDINVTAEEPDSYGRRKSANEKMLAAIRYAEGLHIPVVLTFGFQDPNSRDRRPLDNVFTQYQLPDFSNESIPYRTRVGFDEAPADRREIPLVVAGRRADGAEADYSSFALQIVDAYEKTLDITPYTRVALARQIENHEFVYTSFLLQTQFPHVSAQALLTGNGSALERLQHRIVLIGGNRHENKGSSDWRDNHRLPPLEMRGMYFQANRIEGLLDNRISTLVPRWIALLVDLALGVLLIHYSGLGKDLMRRLGMLGVLFVPVGLAYIVSVNLGYVLDFVLPLLLLFIHIFAEHYLDLRSARSERSVG